MEIEAVKLRRLYMEVADQLSRLIARGDVKVGERLPSERDLATRFGVSRPTIREAMIALELNGIVEIRTGSGVYVLKQLPNPEVSDVGLGPFEILEARMLVESEAASMAAAQLSREMLDKLEGAYERMASQEGFAEKVEQADREFHCIIADGCGNSALASIVHWLWELRQSSGITSIFHERVRKAGSHPSLKEHYDILEAMRARDPEGARLAMRAHLRNTIAALVATMEQSGS